MAGCEDTGGLPDAADASPSATATARETGAGLQPATTSIRDRWSAATLLDAGDVGAAEVLRFAGGWIVAASVHERFAVWTSVDGLDWAVVEEPLAATVDAGSGDRDIGWLSGSAASERGSVVVGRAPHVIGNAEAHAMPLILHSADGTSWADVSPRTTAGLVYDVVAGADGFVAVGDARGAADCPCHPIAWHSRDGIVWNEAHGLAGAFDPEGGITSVTYDGRAFFAIGSADRTDATWTSEDGGGWHRTDLTAPFHPYDLVNAVASTPAGLTIVGEAWDASTNRNSPMAWTSSNGSAWTTRPLDPEVFGDGMGRFARLDGQSGRLVAEGWAHVRADPRFCYADLATCDERWGSVWLSDDGTQWSMLDITPVVTPTSWQVLGAAQHDAALVVAGDNGEGLAVFSWTGPMDAPTRPPLDLMPPPDAPPIAVAGDELEVGVVYGLPVWLHCDLTILGPFNGTEWIVEESVAFPEAAIKDETGYGTVTLAAADRVEYSVDGVVIATLRPRTADDEVLGCF